MGINGLADTLGHLVMSTSGAAGTAREVGSVPASGNSGSCGSREADTRRTSKHSTAKMEPIFPAIQAIPTFGSYSGVYTGSLGTSQLRPDTCPRYSGPGFDQTGVPMRLTVTVYPADRNQFIVNCGRFTGVLTTWR